MITEEMKRFARLLMEGDPEAPDALSRLLVRSGYGAEKKDKGVFDFGSEEFFEHKFSRFRPLKGRTHLISFAWWPGSEGRNPRYNSSSPRFRGTLRNYHAETGYVLNDNPETQEQYNKLFGEPPKAAAATVVIDWPLKRDGKPKKLSGLAYGLRVLPWSFSGHVYNKLKQIHRVTPLGEYALFVRNTNERWNSLEFQPVENEWLPALANSTDSKQQIAYRDLLNQVSKLAPDIERYLGKSLSVKEVRELVMPAHAKSIEIDDLLEML